MRGICLFLLPGLSLFASAQSYVPGSSGIMKVRDSAHIQAQAFPLSEVRLLDGPFKKAMAADAAYLLLLDPDRLLCDFRVHAGLPAKNKKYGGWESEGLAGHTLGHYLSACALQYAAGGDSRFLARVNYIVDELALCQPRRDGYLGAIPKEDSIWAEVKKGNIRSHGFDLDGAWSPWYTVHKIMAGLLDAYLYCNNKRALDLQQKFAGWAERTVSALSPDLFQKMLLCEYGGMNEVLANTYALTGDRQWLDLSRRFHDARVLDSLAAGKDVLPGKHSNTQIPKLIGCARRYELTGNRNDSQAASFFWHTVVEHHSYAPGGNSNYEYFGPADQLSATLSESTMETCNTYNMLKLTRHLFAIDARASYFDFYENALYNDILSSQNHQSGMMCYFVPLRMGGRKEFSDSFNTFTCCVGSGMENHSKYGEAIYAHGSDGSLYVNLFISSVLDWKEKGMTVRMQSDLPADDRVSLSMSLRMPATFTVRIRHPRWALGNAAVSVNGERQPVFADADGYLDIRRSWKNGDKVSVEFPLGIYSIAMPDNPARQAFYYGPVALAGVFGKSEPDPVSGIPAIVTDTPQPASWIKKDDAVLSFFTQRVGMPSDIHLIPFNQVQNDYYSVYFDVFSSAAWQQQQVKYEAEKKQRQWLEQHTVDILRLGEMQPERDHHFTADSSNLGEEHGKKWRSAQNSSLSFTMKVDSSSMNELWLTYWGMDNRGRVFDVMAGNSVIAREDLNRYKESRFYNIHYMLPKELVSARRDITITLRPRPGNTVGPVYGEARMISGNAPINP